MVAGLTSGDGYTWEESSECVFCFTCVSDESSECVFSFTCVSDESSECVLNDSLVMPRCTVHRRHTVVHSCVGFLVSRFVRFCISS